MLRGNKSAILFTVRRLASTGYSPVHYNNSVRLLTVSVDTQDLIVDQSCVFVSGLFIMLCASRT